jgi:hypothetical protein
LDEFAEEVTLFLRDNCFRDALTDVIDLLIEGRAPRSLIDFLECP